MLMGTEKQETAGPLPSRSLPSPAIWREPSHAKSASIPPRSAHTPDTLHERPTLLRPSILDPPFAPADDASPGVGPKLGQGARTGCLGDEARRRRVIDLLFHLPTGAVDRRPRAPAFPRRADRRDRDLRGAVAEHRPAPPGKAKAPYRIIVEDETGDVTLVFFHADVRHLLQSLPIGEYRIHLRAKLELWDGMRQMVHPDRIMDAKAFATLPAIEPVYGLTEGIGGA